MLLPKAKTENTSTSWWTKVTKLTVVVLIAFVILNIWLVNRLSVYGQKIQEIEQTKQTLELDNFFLENQISEASSFSAIEVKSKELGLSTIKNVHYLKAINLASAN